VIVVLLFVSCFDPCSVMGIAANEILSVAFGADGDSQDSDIGIFMSACAVVN
jgi:hypothetical protein